MGLSAKKAHRRPWYLVPIDIPEGMLKYVNQYLGQRDGVFMFFLKKGIVLRRGYKTRGLRDQSILAVSFGKDRC